MAISAHAFAGCVEIIEHGLEVLPELLVSRQPCVDAACLDVLLELVAGFRPVCKGRAHIGSKSFVSRNVVGVPNYVTDCALSRFPSDCLWSGSARLSSFAWSRPSESRPLGLKVSLLGGHTRVATLLNVGGVLSCPRGMRGGNRSLHLTGQLGQPTAGAESMRERDEVSRSPHPSSFRARLRGALGRAEVSG